MGVVKTAAWWLGAVRLRDRMTLSDDAARSSRAIDPLGERHMRAKSSSGLQRSVSIFALVLATSLAGCSSVDNALFGDENTAPDVPPSASSTTTTSTTTTTSMTTADTDTSDAMPGTMPAPAGRRGMAGAPPPLSTPNSVAGTGIMATITPVAIESGPDTGTAVSKTVQSLRSEVETLETHLAANAQRLADLRSAGAGQATTYHETKAHITTRLQVGTTKGNPELVSEWNTAQSALDQLAGTINNLNALGTDLNSDSSSAHSALNSIEATFNVSGAVDEDHRQLAVLEDETQQTLVLIDRLLRETREDVQRQTAYVANERGNLTTLEGAIKSGALYGGNFRSPAPSYASSTSPAGSYGGDALVTIKFDRSNVDYQQILYSALTQALQTQPSAQFQVVAVSPTRGSAGAVQMAQTSAKRHAQDVLKTMTEMGVPATRLAVSSRTDPNLANTEVRVFVR
jgi:hypothetical protein